MSLGLPSPQDLINRRNKIDQLHMEELPSLLEMSVDEEDMSARSASYQRDSSSYAINMTGPSSPARDVAPTKASPATSSSSFKTASDRPTPTAAKRPFANRPPDTPSGYNLPGPSSPFTPRTSTPLANSSVIPSSATSSSSSNSRFAHAFRASATPSTHTITGRDGNLSVRDATFDTPAILKADSREPSFEVEEPFMPEEEEQVSFASSHRMDGSRRRPQDISRDMDPSLRGEDEDFDLRASQASSKWPVMAQSGEDDLSMGMLGPRLKSLEDQEASSLSLVMPDCSFGSDELEEPTSVQDHPRPHGTPSSARRNSRSRLASVEVDLSLVEEEEVEQTSQHGSQSASEEDDGRVGEHSEFLDLPSNVEERETFFDLGRRRGSRSHGQPQRSTSHGQQQHLPPLISSPASISSDSSASTPKNGSSSIASADRHYRGVEASLIRSAGSHASQDGSEDLENGPSPLDTPSSRKEHSLISSVRDLSFNQTPGSKALSTPAPPSALRNSFQHNSRSSAPPTARESSTTSATPGPAPAQPSPATFATPKAYPSVTESRNNIIISALSTSTRPTFKSPFPRRSSFAGRAQSQTPASKFGPSSSHLESDQDGDAANLSIMSSEDLTTLMRTANTSLPLADAGPRNNGGRKLNAHLHQLNKEHVEAIRIISGDRDELELENAELFQRLQDLEARHASSDQPWGSTPSRVTVAGGEQSQGDVELHERIQKLEQALADKDRDLDALRQTQADKIDLLTITPSRSTTPLDPPLAHVELATKLAQNEARLVATTEDLAALTDAHQEQSAEVARLQEGLRRAEELAHEQDQRHLDLVDELGTEAEGILREKEVELAAAVKDLADLQAQLDSALESERKAKMALEERENDLDKGEEEIVARLRDQLAESQAAAASSKALASRLEENVQSLIDTLHARDEELDSIAAALDSPDVAEGGLPDIVKERVAAFQADLDHRKKTFRVSEDKNVELSAKLARAQEMAAVSDRRIAEVMDEMSETADRLAEVRREVEEEKSKASVARKDLELSEQRVAFLEKQVEARAADVSLAVAANSDELARFKDELSVAEKEAQEARADLDVLQQQQLDHEEAHADAMEVLRSTMGEQVIKLEDALHAAETEAIANRATISELEDALADVERKHRLQAAFDKVSSPPESPVAASVVSSSHSASQVAILQVQLESQLAESNAEIRRLKSELARSPFRKTAIETQNLRIQLLEGLNSKHEARAALQGSPVSHADSTIGHRSIVSLATPRPLKALLGSPWTPQGPSTAQAEDAISAEIDRLRHELSGLNQVFDSNIEDLAQLGSDKVTLAEQLAAAREEIERLEAELAAQVAAAQSLSRLNSELVRAQEGSQDDTSASNVKVLSLRNELSQLRDEQSRQQRARDEDLAVFTKKEMALKAQVARLQSDNERASARADVAEAQRRRTALDLTRAQDKAQSIQEDVDDLKARDEDLKSRGEELKTRLKISEASSSALERDIDAARKELSQATGELEHAQRSIVKLEATLAERNQAADRAEANVRSVRAEAESKTLELDQLRLAHGRLDSRLRATQTELAEVNDRVEEVSSSLSSERAQSASLRSALAKSQKGHTALSQAHEAAESTHAREQAAVAREVDRLRDDLARVGEEARRFEGDLQEVRWEVERTGREKELGGERQLSQLRAEITRVEMELAMAQEAAAARKIQHHKECKGLVKAAAHQKAKCGRANEFRDDLAWQKDYLLKLLGHFTGQQARIYGALAQMGHPGPPVPPSPPRPLARFRAAARAVVFLVRTKKDAREWAKEAVIGRRLKEAKEEARERGRRERAAEAAEASMA